MILAAPTASEAVRQGILEIPEASRPHRCPHSAAALTCGDPKTVAPVRRAAHGGGRTYSDGYSGVVNPQTDYQVQVSTNGGFTGIIADSTTLNGGTTLAGPSLSWTVPGSVTLTPSTTHWWRVRAKDGKVWSPWSAGASFVPIPAPILADIESPAEGGVAQGVVTITGTAAGTAFTAYSLQYQAGCTPGGTLVDIGTNPVTTPVTGGTLGAWDTTTPTPLADGPYLLVLTVADATPLVVERCVSLDTTAPVATLATPYASAPVVPVVGTAYDEAAGGFADYVLEYAAGEPLPLAWWDTTGLSGVHTLRLTVHDLLGNGPTVVTQPVYVGLSRQGSDDGGEAHPFDPGGDWSMAVGVADGELALERTLFTIPSYGPAQSMTIYYASDDADADGLLGLGWSSDLTQRLEEVGTLVLVWHTADGSLLPFTWNGGAWVPPAGRHETITHEAGNGRYVLTDPDLSYLRFADSGDGRLLAACDRFDQCLDLAWAGSTVTATDDSGRDTTITLSSGRIASAEDSAGREWGFVYSSGTLSTITDPEGGVTELSYGGPDGRLTAIDRDRQLSGSTDTITWEVAYDGDDRVETVLDPVGAANTPDRFHAFSYGDGATTVASPLDLASGTTVTVGYTLDARGRLTELQSPTELQTSIALNADGDPRKVTVAPDSSEETVTTYEYVEGTGAVDVETAPGPDGTLTTEYGYDPGTTDVTSIVVKEGATVLQETAQDWVAGELRETTVDPGGLDLTTEYDYTAKHQLEFETSPRGVVTKYEYDADGNMTARIDNYVSDQSATSSRNVTTTWDHDAAGNVVSEIDPRGIETTYAYDLLGQQTRVTRNDVSGTSSAGDEDLTERTWYDALGWVVATEDPRGTVTRHVTDRLGRVTATIVNCTDSGTTPTSSPTACVGAGTHNAATNVLTDMPHDARGNLLSSTIRYPGDSSKDVRTEHTYDADGNLLVTIVDQGSGKLNLTTRTAYDILGNRIAELDPRSTTTTWAFDDAGNVIEEVRNRTSSGTTTLTSGTSTGCTGGGTANATWNVGTMGMITSSGPT